MRRRQLATLDNGVRILTESWPDSRSATLGIWVQVGSRDESLTLSGVSHFLEHLLARGTGRRSGEEISELADAMGGQLNPFTNREQTCLCIRVRDHDVPDALDLLLDMLLSPALTVESVESERQVILEEIRAYYQGDGDHVALNALCATIFSGHPLSRPVLGDPKSIARLEWEAIQAFHGRHYHRANGIVVSAVGSVNHQFIVAQVGRLLGQLAPAREFRELASPITRPCLVHVDRPFEQTHVAVAVPGVTAADPDRIPLEAITYILGGGMAGHFVREIRDNRGMAYNAYAYQQNFTDAGVLSLHATVAPENSKAAIDIALETLRKLCTTMVTAQELDRAKRHLSSRLVLDLEGTLTCTEYLVHPLLYGHGSTDPVGYDVQAMYDSLTLDDCARVFSKLQGTEPTVVTVGPS